MDLSQFSPAQLEDVAVSLFEEIAKRKLTTAALAGAGAAVLVAILVELLKKTFW